jgi:zinc transport system ATP-binding protein
MKSQQVTNPAGGQIAVRFDSVSFSYGDVPALENASFHIHRGEFAALVGPNGSGKTTVLKLILGLEQPASGKVTLFGIHTGNSRRQSGAWRDRLGYVPQYPPADQSFPVTVRDVVRMGLLRPLRGYGAKAGAAVSEAMEQAGIGDLAARPWRALSGGQRRRVLVARALAARPELLILDEPTANMDTESEGRLFETLGNLKGGINATGTGATILIVTHDMNFVSALTDRVFCLGDGANGFRNIVRHRTEAAPEGSTRHGGGAQGAAARVLHGENIPDNECCE